MKWNSKRSLNRAKESEIMPTRLADRIAYITGKLRTLGFQSIILAAYRPGPTSIEGYFKLNATKQDFRVFTAELILGGSVIKYSYTLLYGGKVILRYDNAPHHPHIETFPHHKHEDDKITPLFNPSVDAFIEDAKQIIKDP
ncbi:MAG: DUF6516 family protein [Desulfurococcales archaeon]|nr:DUF6516 family protein [Desulfurococcales archaeon]